MTSDSNWASVMYGSDASPAPVPAAKPAPAPAATTAVMHKPTAPASDWTATMHKVEEPTGEPGQGLEQAADAMVAEMTRLSESHELGRITMLLARKERR